MTREEIEAVLDVLDSRAAASDRIGVPERAVGFRESARMLREALAKSETEAASSIDRVIATAEETARLKREAAESERRRTGGSRTTIEMYRGEAHGIGYVCRLLRAHGKVTP